MKTRRSGRADTQQRLLPLVAVRALGHRSRWGKFDEQAKPGKQADQHQVVEHEPQVEQHADRCEEDGGEYHLKWRDIALGPVAVLARRVACPVPEMALVSLRCRLLHLLCRLLATRRLLCSGHCLLGWLLHRSVSLS